MSTTESTDDEVRVSDLRRRGLRGRLLVLGPAFVAAVAYVDPGNFATNFAAGAQFGYLLLWVILVANVMAMLIQSLSAKLGVATGKNLPELCREHFPRVGEPRDVGAGRARRHRDRPGRGRRWRDRAEPAVRDPAVHRRRDHRRDRVRPAGAAEPRAPAVRAGHRAAPRRDPGGSGQHPVPDRRRPGRRARRPHPAVRRRGEPAAGDRHPRCHGHAARDLPALRADPAPAARRVARRQDVPAPHRAVRHRARARARRAGQPVHAGDRGGAVRGHRRAGHRHAGRNLHRPADPARRRRGHRVRDRAARLRVRLLRGRDLRRTGDHGGIPAPPDPAAAAPRAHPGARAGRARARRRPDTGAGRSPRSCCRSGSRSRWRRWSGSRAAAR